MCDGSGIEARVSAPHRQKHRPLNWRAMLRCIYTRDSIGLQVFVTKHVSVNTLSLFVTLHRRCSVGIMAGSIEQLLREIKSADEVCASVRAMGLEPQQLTASLDRLMDSIIALTSGADISDSAAVTRLAYALAAFPFSSDQRRDIHESLQRRLHVGSDCKNNICSTRKRTTYIYQHFAVSHSCQFFFTDSDYQACADTSQAIGDAFHRAVNRMRKLRMDEPSEAACADIACLVAVIWHNRAMPDSNVLKG